ncbi:MAG: class B sortase, partial [Lachnospiraceae bacterium]|nr:class B sortase [Lachnospiraceae bacterium]
MTQKVFVVEGRQFRSESDYACAKRDKEIIDRLRAQTDFEDREALEKLGGELRAGRYKFGTLLGQDFRDEVEALLKKAGRAERKTEPKKRGLPAGGQGRKAAGGSDRNAGRAGDSAGRAGRQTGESPGRAAAGRTGLRTQTKEAEAGPGERADRQEPVSEKDRAAMEEIVAQELRKRERRRKLILLACSAAAVCCLGYFAVYSYYDYRTRSTYDALSELKEKPVIAPTVTPEPGPQYTLDGEAEPREVLEEYQNLLLKNRKLIGWVKIDDTYIDYPVMQTTDNEYYLDHNMNQEYDKNGTIFMDKDCDVLKPSTN